MDCPINDYEFKYYDVKYKKFGANRQVIVYSKPVAVGVQSRFKGKTKAQIMKPYKDINDYKFRTFRSAKNSSRRSKNKVYDVSRSNNWEWFLTVTFNPEKVDSYDYEIVTKELSHWIKKIRERKANKGMKYIFVPELHKKSGRYHFHGLIEGAELEMTDSGHFTKGGEKIYNIGSYDLGFTTATKVMYPDRVQMYLAKYITKELSAVTKGKKRYWRSKNCSVPEVEYYCNGRESHMKLHDQIISRDDFLVASEKEYLDTKGKFQYTRYYELGGSAYAEGNNNQTSE